MPQAALKSLKEQAAAKGGLKGLVLDMRGNPGGLLDQAIQISDLFLDEGTIVATVGGGAGMRDEKPRAREPFDRELPIAVLVNSGSASASEIVAGALKNLDRAVIIGRQTFGKGSVQVLYDFPDDSALKLTIAKYLTPGDKSIQEVGIMPDIELTPTRVTRDRVDVYAPRKTVGEADLDKHFGNPDSEQVAKKREDVLNREKPLAQVALPQGGREEPRRGLQGSGGQEGEGQGPQPAAGRGHHRRPGRARRPDGRREPGRDQGGLRGPLRPRLRAPGAVHRSHPDAGEGQGPSCSSPRISRPSASTRRSARWG